ncbi:MAG: hypothetical protein KatS3mg110_2205 [Pirellulaceae bacterium]|nr:MAG: hypothetical protein KatS3mg110_2205 [Pirellulaceae bacterium]
MAEQCAARIERCAAGGDTRQQIRLLYQWAYAREPEAQELEDALELVHRYGLRALCRAVFNSNEFLTLR